MENRIRNLPIYVGDSAGNIYHILNDKVPRRLQRTKTVALSILKTRPDVIGEAERVGPYQLIFYPTFREDYRGVTYGDVSYVCVFSPKKPTEPLRLRVGATAIHELEHVRSYKEAYKKHELKIRNKKVKTEENRADRRALQKSSDYYTDPIFGYTLSKKNPKKELPEDDVYASFIRTTY
jgi:hypothetical protein